MNQEPDIILSISGTHKAKGIIAVVIANALKEANITVNHLNYDEETFEQMTRVVNESNESTLTSSNVLIVEYDEDYIDTIHQTQIEPEFESRLPAPPGEVVDNRDAYVGRNPNWTEEQVEEWKKNLAQGAETYE